MLIPSNLYCNSYFSYRILKCYACSTLKYIFFYVLGPIIWFQMFEYACGHWLQKAAEHVFGCVLCAPGCFSLFRGSAMMDDNVMNTYTSRASKASEFVQYDQGELSTTLYILLHTACRCNRISFYLSRSLTRLTER